VYKLIFGEEVGAANLEQRPDLRNRRCNFNRVRSIDAADVCQYVHHEGAQPLVNVKVNVESVIHVLSPYLDLSYRSLKRV